MGNGRLANASKRLPAGAKLGQSGTHLPRSVGGVSDAAGGSSGGRRPSHRTRKALVTSGRRITCTREIPTLVSIG